MRRIATVLALTAMPAVAQEAIVQDYAGSYDDAVFELEQAILAEGLVVDFVSHVGEMLERTRDDVGSDVQLFDNAEIFVFCSALVSREVMEQDPMNLVHCPYGIFVAEREGKVMLGYRDYPDGPMQKVEDMLGGIVDQVTGG